MRRTQLYLDDTIWNALHVLARNQKTTISQLVRDAVREHYIGNREEQRKAMKAFVGSRKESGKLKDSVDVIRELRQSGRLDRFERARKL